MESWLQDARYSIRTLLKRPGFTIVAVVSLALGIGANTAIFTVINAVFLHPLAITDPARVVEVFTRDTKTQQAANFTLTPSSLQNYQDYRDENTVLSGLAGYFVSGLQWTPPSGDPEGLPAMMTTGNYFDVLGVTPAMGRLFGPDQDRPTTSAVVVMSHDMWTTHFGSDPAIVNKTITLNNMPFVVIGVTPAGFKGTLALAGTEWLWVPLGLRDQLLVGQIKALSVNRRFRWISMVGRLAPGVTVSQAQASLKTIAGALEQHFPDANQGRTVEVASVANAALGINNRSQFVQVGAVLMTVVSLVLFIACANLANLLLAQSARREREISIRAAMGAARGRVIRQLLIESVMVSAAGGVLGLVVAYWGRNALWAFRPPFLGNASIDLSLDVKVLAFTAAVSLATGVLFGLLPALRMSRADRHLAARLGGRSGGLDRGHNHIRSALVSLEIALATVALVGSGLFVRSMQAVETMDVGFDARRIAFVRLNPGSQHYETARGLQFYDDAAARARAMPGVQAATVGSLVPVAGGAGVLLTTFPEGQAQNSTYRGSLITFDDIGTGFFDTLRIPMRRGRDFTSFDRDTTTPVAIVNEAAAKQLWPGSDAIGKRFTIIQRPDLFEVVGVVADAVMNAVGEDPTPVIYRPLTQEYAAAASLIVRADDPERVVGLVRDQVQTLDPRMPLRNTGTAQQQIEQGLWAPRMGAVLLSIFGGLALALAMIGIYGVMAYSVSQRTPEIGVRIAFGAQPADVVRLMMRQGLILALAGAITGVIAALGLGRMISNLLFGISPADPMTLLLVTGILTTVALAACYIPARRATRVDPLTALRQER